MLFDYLQNNREVDMSFLCREILYTMAHMPSITKKDLENRYLIPVSNIPGEELWERKIPLREQRIYKAWASKMPVKEIQAKYKINRRKVYTIIEKVKKYGKHDEIINKNLERKTVQKPISYRDWSIFIDVCCDGSKITDVAHEHGLAVSTIRNILKKVRIRPEGAAIISSDKCVAPHQHLGTVPKHRNEIYKTYKLLENTFKNKNEIYEIIARKYHLKPNTIRHAIYISRKDDTTETFRAHTSKGKWTLPTKEHYKYLQERNCAIVAELKPLFNRERGACQRIGEKYGVSRTMALTIYKNQEKYLHVYDNYIKKRQDITQQEQNPEWEET